MRHAFFFALLLTSLLLSACAGELDILHQLNEQEANQILVVLESQGITGNKFKEEGRTITYAIVVPEPDAAAAMRLLVENHLPKERSGGLMLVYPPGSSGLIPTNSEEKAKFLMALQGEIDAKLKAFPGILRAHVNVVIPDDEIIRDQDKAPPKATASVAIVYNPGPNGKKPLSDEEVQKLTAASIEGLAVSDVTVIQKKNSPLVLITESGESGVAGPTETVLGIKVVGKNAGKRAKTLLFGFMGLAVIGLALGVFGILRSVMLKGKLSKSEHEVTALKKSRREVG